MTETTIEAGTLIDGRHRVEGVIGRGGFATVYLGVDTQDTRSVAIKVLHEDQASPRDRARFEREIGIVAKLRDPHTVRLLSHGRLNDGRRFIVFEHLPGKDLAQILHERTRLPPGAVRQILRQLLQSLREAHAAGVLHRDIKPENIRVFADGEDLAVKLLDFGIARSTDPRDTGLTATGELLGTPRYMSPEQILEQPLSPASDLYSAGLVALEMLTGRDALHGNQWLDQIDRLQTGHVFVIEDPDEELLRVLQRMTARDLAERFQTADSVLLALDASSSGEAPTPARSIWPLVLPFGVAVAALAAALLFTARPDDEFEPLPTPVVTPTAIQRLAAPPAPVEDARQEQTITERADGCGAEPKWHGFQERFASYGLQGIEFVAYVPLSYDPTKRHPVVLLFHSTLRSPQTILRAEPFDDIADRHGTILIAPAGRGGSGPWDDVEPEAIMATLDYMNERFCIDLDRVYAFGHGAGGRFAMALRCAMPLSAVVLAMAGQNRGQRICESSPTPILRAFGDRDPYVPLEGGSRCWTNDAESADDADRGWRERNLADSGPTVWRKADDGECLLWTGAAAFVSCKLRGGHRWGDDATEIPGCDSPPITFPIGEAAWDFFEEHGRLRRAR